MHKICQKTSCVPTGLHKYVLQPCSLQTIQLKCQCTFYLLLAAIRFIRTKGLCLPLQPWFTEKPLASSGQIQKPVNVSRMSAGMTFI